MHTDCVSVNTYSITDPPTVWGVVAASRKGRYKTKAEQYLMTLLLEFYQKRY